MKLLFIADVSGGTSHVGDEAMLEANISLFRRLLPGSEMIVAAGTGWNGGRLGVKTVPRLEFSPHSKVRRDELLQSLNFAPDTQHPAVSAAMTCDVLIISGGGNLSGTWPHHTYERIAMARLAVSNGAKVLILGQTLGPEFQSNEADLVSELLRYSIWTGLRETYSYALALELGAERETLSYQLDDATFLLSEPIPEKVSTKLVLSESRPWIAVTVHPIGEASVHNPVIARLASCLRSIVNATAADIVFVPHVSFEESGETPDDEVFGEALARALYGNPMMRIAPVLSAAQSLWLTQQAALIISTRYHPLVFGLSAAIPAIGVWSDEYTRRKIQGALIHARRPEDALELEDALAGRLVTKALDLWDARSALRGELQTKIVTWHEAERERITKLAELLVSDAKHHDGSYRRTALKVM